MKTLCEKCFPEWGDVEVLTMTPLTPCEECGAADNRYSGGTRVNLFRADPYLKAA